MVWVDLGSDEKFATGSSKAKTTYCPLTLVVVQWALWWDAVAAGAAQLATIVRKV